MYEVADHLGQQFIDVRIVKLLPGCRLIGRQKEMERSHEPILVQLDCKRQCTEKPLILILTLQ